MSVDKSYSQFQIARRGSTVDYDRGIWAKLIQLRYEETNWNRETVRHTSDIEYNDYANSERDITKYETDDNWGSEFINSSPSKLHNQNTSKPQENWLEMKLEEDFNPGIFGLINNPGVLRLTSVNYPLTVTEKKL